MSLPKCLTVRSTSLTSVICCVTEIIHFIGVRKTMEHFFGLRETEQFDEEEAIDDFEVQKQDIDYLYQIIKDYHSSNILEDNIDPQHKSLLPRLRKYQKEAVIWMVNREKMETDSKPNIHPLYTEVKSKDGKVLYYNRKGGFLVKDFPVEIQLPSGGNDDLNQICEHYIHCIVR